MRSAVKDGSVENAYVAAAGPGIERERGEIFVSRLIQSLCLTKFPTMFHCLECLAFSRWT